ncbi:N-acetylneuraminate epimerase [Poriferisphaera corsica]|uniref:N-acetylneuraminate epimerase n=1 Tax=Poriferisphaera corsica TaxID=2528020 RepID=A0A517YRQ6_9BACT|nr:hypothetical protein [Poriferisphaera corsica]QDU32905.1 N-acetylneuraminate epimerase [Poriferisphaera corsica]
MNQRTLKSVSIIIMLALTALLGLSGCAYDPTFASISHDDIGWEQHTSMPVGVIAAAGSYSSKNDAYVVSGGIKANGDEATQISIYKPNDDTWHKGSKLHIPRFMHQQIELPDGRILIIGGRQFGKGQYEPLRSCEIISNDYNKTVVGDSLPITMAVPTAHALNDGNILAISNDYAAIYNSKTNTWEKELIRLCEDRIAHTSVQLNTKQILVIGGESKRTMELIDMDSKRSRLLGVRLPRALDDAQAMYIGNGKVWLIGGQDGKTGETVKETHLIHVGQTSDDDKIERGPRLPHTRGVADHLLIQTQDSNGNPIAVMVGGESQFKGSDLELREAYLLLSNGLRIYPLPRSMVAHDDAVGFTRNGRIYVLGGQVTGDAGGYAFLNMPRPVKTVESLKIPDIIKRSEITSIVE